VRVSVLLSFSLLLVLVLHVNTSLIRRSIKLLSTPGLVSRDGEINRVKEKLIVGDYVGMVE